MRAIILLVFYTVPLVLIAPFVLLCMISGMREPIVAVGKRAMRYVGCVPVEDGYFTTTSNCIFQSH
jgi:hypothetical protein